ncbi:hypothetical protein [Marinobacter arenosus]|uniref:hypothetical protein n=1 Tax=Marinobacter arenosus TaxID=2856822 RepID=UPI001C4D8434|nr:hypothetical protein [Marinobacter arenosus]MBW0149006.1 hypothetical protein [Marinobacter arenosus]
MKQVVICSATLAMTLFVAPLYGDNWERQNQRQAMMEHQAQMDSSMAMRHSYSETEQNRRRQLERGAPQSIEDIESLPSTAAGRPDDRGMEYRDDMNDRRKGHRGEIEYDY